MVEKCDTLADIGTDHGYLPSMLIDEGIVNRVIATDLNKGPLSRAVEYLTLKGFSKKCDFRLGSGLEVLNPYEAEAIVIAGMGGDLISDILETSKKISQSTKQIIVQPMTAIDNLRRYLYNNGYKIVDEKISKEYHHYYFIIKAEVGYEYIENEIFYEFSRSLILKRDPIMFEYMQKIINTNKKIIDNLVKTKNVEYTSKIESIKKKNLEIMELINFES